MNPVACMDLIAAAASLAALMTVLFGRSREVSRDTRLALVALITCTFGYAACMYLQWSGITSQLETVEDLAGALLPMFWVFVLYTLLQGIAQRDLRESRQLLDALIEHSPDHIYFKDDRSRFRRISLAQAVRFGLSAPEQAVGKTDFDFFASEHAQAAYADEQDVMRSGRPMVGKEEREDWPDGRETWVSTTKVPLRDSSDRIIGTFGISRDITENKKAAAERTALEAQIRHLQKLESLGVLAGGIAHDFNNLLVGILGNADLVLPDLPEGSGSRRTVEEIKRAALRASELTGQMLAYSGRGQFVIKAIDLNQLVAEMDQLLEASIPKHVTVEQRFAPNLPSIDADAPQVRQVVMNLLTNAAEAIGNKPGRIIVATGVADLGNEPEGLLFLNDASAPAAHVYLDVADDGAGMDDDTRKRIFDPFYTTKFTGRGLGLACVLGIIRGHNGAVQVKSALGKGTSFRVFFPGSEAAPPPPEVVKSKSLPRPISGSATVLVVDDEDDVRRIASLMLQRDGYNVHEAADGCEALDIFRDKSDTIDLVLLDMTMPRMGGEETLRELHKIRPDVPVILSSGYNEKETTQRFGPRELAGFVQKPFEMSTLLEKVADAIAKAGHVAE